MIIEVQNESIGLLWMEAKHKVYRECGNNHIFLEPSINSENTFMVTTQGLTLRSFGTPIDNVWYENGVWNLQIDTITFNNVLNFYKEQLEKETLSV